jgi:hypothetical protein
MSFVGPSWGAEFLRNEFQPVIDRYWVNKRGLKTAHILTQSLWKKNLVTGAVGGSVAGTGVTFPNRLLRTPGTTNNGANFVHNLGMPDAYSVVVGARFISGNVMWSMLKPGAWTGVYSGGTGSANTTSVSSFDGSIVCGGDGSLALAFRGANQLVGYGRGGIRSEDTSCAFSNDISAGVFRCGWANSDNPGVGEFTHVYLFLGGLKDEELQLLAYDPMAIFVQRRRSMVFYTPAAGASLPTLSASTYKPGTLTADGWQPRVTAS